jgi:esterase/lipase
MNESSFDAGGLEGNFAGENRSERSGVRGCLLIHGFTGGPFELMPLSRRLAEMGWDCTVPTLAGHENELQRIGAVSYTEWIEGMEREAERMSKRYGSFDLVGFSMGGLIAAYLANRCPVRRLVLLSTAVVYISPLRFGRELVAQIKSGRIRDEAAAKLTGARWRATLQFMRLVRRLKPELETIQVPTLIVHGLKDHVVHPYSAKIIERKIKGPKEVRLFPESRHLICLDVEAEAVIDAVAGFLQRSFFPYNHSL